MTSLISRPAVGASIANVVSPVGSDSRAAVVRAIPEVVALREPNSRPALLASIPSGAAPVGPNSRAADLVAAAEARSLREFNSHATNPPAIPRRGSSRGSNSRPAEHPSPPGTTAPDGVQLAARHMTTETHRYGAGSDQQGRDRAAGPASMTRTATLLDPALSLAADFLDDIERVKIANENRLRSLTRVGTDADGVDRYIGLEADHPVVAQLAKMVESLVAVEHDAVLTLQRMVRKHPLGAWIKAQKGIGEKQGARLLASIGDPYWRPEIVREDGTVLHEGPRTVSALWAYCGLKPGQRRQKGVQSNWSARAKSRAYLVAEKCMVQIDKKTCPVGDDKVAVHADGCACSPYRMKYDERRARTNATHPEWTDGHRNADALHVTSKEILKDLWRAGRDWHLAQKESS